MGIVAWWINHLEESKEACRAKDERHNSVNCPYCSRHHSSTDIHNYGTETDVDNVTAIKCETCESVFGVETKRCYEPCPAMWKESKKIWKNLSFDYDGIE